MKTYYYIGGADSGIVRGVEGLDEGHKLHEFGQHVSLSDEEAAHFIGVCHLPVLPEEGFVACGFTPGASVFKPGMPRHAPTLAERDPEFGRKYYAALAALAQLRAAFAASQEA